MPGRGRRLLSAQARLDPRRMAAWRNRHRIVAFGGATLAGILVYSFAPEWLHGATRFVAAYDAGTITLLTFFWTKGLHDDPQLTRARAALDDPGKNAILLVVLGAVVVGLVAAIAILGHGPMVQNAAEKWAAYILGIVAISAGWVLVHTVYTFRYAHMFYYDDDGDGSACGGIDFPGTPEPCDWDFAYFAFCIGTSFAVSDPNVNETRIRREVIGHSVISFAYNSVIVGMVINIFAGIFAAGSSGGK